MRLDRSRLDHADAATDRLLHDPSTAIHGYLADPQNIKGIVCIGAWGRSGSGLMSSMVDGHPEIVQVYPQHSLNEIYLQALPALGDAGSIEDIVNAILKCFQQVSGHSESWTSLIEERAGVFSEVLAHLLSAQSGNGVLTRRLVLLAVHAAYAFAMDCLPATDRPLIIWQSHANDFAMRRQIREDFPEVRFIVMARYPPRARDSALLAFAEALPKAFPKATDQFFHAHRFSISLLNLIHMGEMGRRMYPDEDIIAVRFEDLHMRTRETMTWLAGWLGIGWHDALLQSTLRGLPWGKHSMYPVYGSRFNVGTRTLSWDDYYTRGQSAIDLLKYRAYQDEFMRDWLYTAPPLSKGVRYIALRILCFWPVRLQWRTLRSGLRKAGFRWPGAIVQEFMTQHRQLATEFRAEYIRQRQAYRTNPVVRRATVCEERWPGAEISRRRQDPG